MATTYTLKRKTYSDDSNNTEETGLSTTAKIGLGVAGAGLMFAGARRGMFGTKMAAGANKAYANVGKAIGRDKMVFNAAQKQGKVEANALAKNLSKNKNITLSQGQIDDRADKVASRRYYQYLK